MSTTSTSDLSTSDASARRDAKPDRPIAAAMHHARGRADAAQIGTQQRFGQIQR